MTSDPRHWLLWDGDCGMCRQSAAWVEARDLHHRFRAQPYQQAPSPPMTPELREACANAVHVVTDDGRVLRSGRASLFILSTLGWPVGFLAWPPFIWIVEPVYRLVARNRPRHSCRIGSKS